MNSKELNVNVPLATCDADFDDFGEFTEMQSAASPRPSGAVSVEGGLDCISGSLEDLVATFDEKLTVCFGDFKKQVDKIAPVQVRSQDEIMNECQVWWTLTGNFGNMMPIDWTKTYTRANYIPTLNLCAPRQTTPCQQQEFSQEDDLVAADLDMHQLILQSDSMNTSEPIKSAEEVLQEIDDIIDEDEEEEEDGAAMRNPVHTFLPPHSIRSSTFIGQALQGRKLEELSVSELTQILSDVEVLVRDLSEELVVDLGKRDELEYEKELKNNFISLLLSIQSKRRQHCPESGQPRKKKDAGQFKYLTTVIPYNPEKGCPPLQTLQVLVKILKNINDDSPAVPALLTDYILKVLCPT